MTLILVYISTHFIISNSVEVSIPQPIVDSLSEGQFSGSSEFDDTLDRCLFSNARYTQPTFEPQLLCKGASDCPEDGGSGSWCPTANDKDSGEKPYLIIDLGTCYTIVDVGTKGRIDRQQWATTYILSYKLLAGDTWTDYGGAGNIIEGNDDYNTEVLGVSSSRGDAPIFAQFVRFTPQEWDSCDVSPCSTTASPSMRVEVYGIIDRDCDQSTDCLCSDGETEGTSTTTDIECSLIDPAAGICDTCCVTQCVCSTEICTDDPTIDPTIDPTGVGGDDGESSDESSDESDERVYANALLSEMNMNNDNNYNNDNSKDEIHYTITISPRMWTILVLTMICVNVILCWCYSNSRKNKANYVRKDSVSAV